MSGDVLIAFFDNHEVGRIERDRRNRLEFSYAGAWRSHSDAFPVSLSLPLAAERHAHESVENFLWGLLPDNEQILERWARRFQVSARNPFALLSHVGEECAGAIQFVSPERDKTLISDVAWLTEEDVAQRLSALRTDHSAWRLARDSGQFSLAGAQPKTALLYQDGRWGVPRGNIPTTHILKPPTGEFEGHVWNEHFCLTLARVLGLPSARSELQRFGEETAIVIERFDRVVTPTGALLRVHQEDMCQAMGLSPLRKYQNDGGPSVKMIVALLRMHSSSAAVDVASFIDALGFSWLTAGTDAHAKNYALLHSPGRVRLAPLYDLSSALPYEELDFMRLKLAMKIGGKYRIRDIGLRQWHQMATEIQLEPAVVVQRLIDHADSMVVEIQRLRQRLEEQGLGHPIIGRLADRILQRVKACRSGLHTLPL